MRWVAAASASPSVEVARAISVPQLGHGDGAAAPLRPASDALVCRPHTGQMSEDMCSNAAMSWYHPLTRS
jgi:hypothetical protein